MRPGAALLAALVVFFVTGCGGEQVVAPTAAETVGSVPKAGPQVKGDATAGKQVFLSTKAGCGNCHTLKDAGTNGTVGPNLDQRKPSLEKALDRVTNGKTPMPAFKGVLTDKQIADVAAYVVQATSGG